ncbi:MAG: hypothetical protein HQK53_03100 [Oligoflexia bacterium]|nr:hypothetical protein [Oligoflexia bacterium]
MKKILLSVAVASFLSSSVFAAWPGAQRPASEPKVPVDTPHSTGKLISADRIEVSLKVSNKTSATNKKCDYYSTIFAYNNAGDSMQIEAFNNGLLKTGRDSTWVIYFDGTEVGTLYKMKRESLRMEAACLEDVPANANQSPHQSCDPSTQNCGWTCQASQQDPSQCARPNQDWSNSNDIWL